MSGDRRDVHVYRYEFCVAWSLLDFAVHRVSTHIRIELLDFQFLSLRLFVARGGVTGRRLPGLARFSAFDGYDFTWHKSVLIRSSL